MCTCILKFENTTAGFTCMFHAGMHLHSSKSGVLYTYRDLSPRGTADMSGQKPLVTSLGPKAQGDAEHAIPDSHRRCCDAAGNSSSCVKS